jgi:hypothetical protein
MFDVDLLLVMPNTLFTHAALEASTLIFSTAEEASAV